jgi:8-oxo-dGTP pyrophosphatase MutT (NUDIX family)
VLPSVADDAAFRAVGEKTTWTGRRIRVAEVEVDSPDGRRLEREVVHHPGAVAMLPLHDDGTVTLVRQYRAALDRDMWEIPAGLREEGEAPERTAHRELVEEAGLAAAELVPLTTFHNSPGFCDEAVVIYLATGLTSVPDDRQGPEEQHMAVVQVPLEEAVAMVHDGRITDAKTVIGLLLMAGREREASDVG